MLIEQRLFLLEKLRGYLLSNTEEWKDTKERARSANGWFTENFVEDAVQAIVEDLLPPSHLKAWLSKYTLPDHAVKVGIVMAGNIPLVGFHDFLCGFLSGHTLYLKLSSKDAILLAHIVRKLIEWDPEVSEQIHVADMLKGCDAYIATGSNNSGRYFLEYFGKYAHLIRKNRTSVAVLSGAETPEDLQLLCKDMFQYYGLGCRNVTQLFLPEGYDFEPLITATQHWAFLADNHKYNNNYDYQLAIYLLNQVPYLTNGSLLLVENPVPFTAVSVLHYQFYKDKGELTDKLKSSEDIQCIVGDGYLPFGQAQHPGLLDYADGADTMAFLCSL